MSQEIPKSENIDILEEGTDLYDGMILSTLETGPNYVESLDIYSLKKIVERAKIYHDIMNDSDYTKGEKLTEKLGIFINKHTLKSLIDHISFILTKVENNLDIFDTLFINSLEDNTLLNSVEDELLLKLKTRLIVYYSLISSDNPNSKEELYNRLGRKIDSHSIKDLIAYIDNLLRERDREAEIKE